MVDVRIRVLEPLEAVAAPPRPAAGAGEPSGTLVTAALAGHPSNALWWAADLRAAEGAA